MDVKTYLRIRPTANSVMQLFSISDDKKILSMKNLDVNSTP